jgi:peptide/nickel transport system ATP-binding protein
MSAPLLELVDLEVSYRQQAGWQPVLRKVNFAIQRGEAFGLVGESGCGKSTVALQLLGYRPPASRIDGGQVLFQGRDLLRLERGALDKLRGDRISFVPQNPTTALNPGIRVGEQVAEILLAHDWTKGGRAKDQGQAAVRMRELFGLVGLPDPERLPHRFPHQLSGGQQQRVCIAMALACEPDLVVLDEPTTGLDVTTQEQIVELLIELRRRLHMSMLYVTHDLGVLAEIADRVGVMYAGHMVEIAPTADLFGQPRHPYTRGLIASIPRIDQPQETAARPLRGLLRRDELPPGCPFQPRCDFAEASCAERHQILEPVAPGHEVACQRWRALGGPQIAAAGEAAPARAVAPDAPLLALEEVTLAYGVTQDWLARLAGSRRFTAVKRLSLAIARGETFALVGESGSGKSTVARAVSGLLTPAAGRILLKGRLLPGLVAARSGEQRRQIQYIFQNPDASLNPRAKVGEILARPLEMFFSLDRRTMRERVAQALADTRLDARYAQRYPDQLSGGERQRVAIARALIAEPELLLCDEVLSALDVSVQANILDLLRRLRERHSVAMLFISHDLAVVRQLADRVGVMYRGELMETGPTADVFTPPFHPYTHSLILAVPSLDRAGERRMIDRLPAKPPSATQACAFAGRCPWQPGAICEKETPPWRLTAPGTLGGKAIRCHLPLPELAQRAAAISPAMPAPDAQDDASLPSTAR